MKKIMPLVLVLLVLACENKDINEGEAFRPREINEDFENFHFNRIKYDGVEYLITERDNNNPHEGFGFMAFRPNAMIYRQDSILAHLNAIAEMQTRIYARMYGISEQQSTAFYDSLFSNYLELNKTTLTNTERKADNEQPQ